MVAIQGIGSHHIALGIPDVIGVCSITLALLNGLFHYSIAIRSVSEPRVLLVTAGISFYAVNFTVNIPINRINSFSIIGNQITYSIISVIGSGLIIHIYAECSASHYIIYISQPVGIGIIIICEAIHHCGIIRIASQGDYIAIRVVGIAFFPFIGFCSASRPGITAYSLMHHHLSYSV